MRQVDQLDRMLDELEEAARSNLPTSRFFVTVVDRLRLTLQARTVLLLFPVDGKAESLPTSGSGERRPGNVPSATERTHAERSGWLPLARSGEECSQAVDALRASLAKQIEPVAVLMGEQGGEAWYAAPLRPKAFSRGCLLVCMPHAVPASSLAGVLELLSAFTEVVAMRQTAELESFLDDYWQDTQALCRQISATGSFEEACGLLANGLVGMLRATRVSVFIAGGLSGPSLRAISGAPHLHAKSKSVIALRQVGKQIFKSDKPLLRQQPYAQIPDSETLPEIAEDGTFCNLIGTRLSNSTSSNRAATAILVEYANYPELVASAAKLPYLLPTIAGTWEQHARWLSLPRTARTLIIAPARTASLLRPLLKWGFGATALVLAAWALTRPAPLVIESQGAYEPVVSRMVYSTHDGFIEELLVDDGQTVQAEQVLLRLRAPELELRIEATLGEMRALGEEREGVRIAMNQLDPDSPDQLRDQSRLAAKVAELDIKEKNVKARLALLRQQESRLIVRAPIAGVVVGKDLRQHLQDRPVGRGDPLVSVVDLQGPWQIRLQVADCDSGYVFEHFADSDSGPQQREIEYVLDSRPDERLPATLATISDRVENQHGEGCYVEVRAGIDPQSAPTGAHAGAGVHAFFNCGQQPTWFVWCRPLIEAAQRRLWFRDPNEHE